MTSKFFLFLSSSGVWGIVTFSFCVTTRNCCFKALSFAVFWGANSRYRRPPWWYTIHSAVCTVCTVEWSDLALFRLTKIATFLSIRYIFRSSITKKSAKASFQNIRNKFFFIIVIPQSGQNGFWPGQRKNKKCLDCFLQKI